VVGASQLIILFEDSATPQFNEGEAEFLRQAVALLFPIDWPEPFGLVMIEALAAGTPVIAVVNGSVGEVIENGRTGFAVASINEAVAATRAALGLDRRRIRAAFEARFSVGRMAEDYLDLYRDLILDRHWASAPPKNRAPTVRRGAACRYATTAVGGSRCDRMARPQRCGH
jgi:glycosyltransferase involved in cell wall biosynthesis